MQAEKPTKTPVPSLIAKFESQANIDFVPQANILASLSISTGVVSQTTDLHMVQINALTSFAEQLAIGLAGTLNILMIYNKPATYRIVSILSPYMEAIPELGFPIPSKSSREVVIEVTREGRIPPKFYFDESL